MTKLTRFVYSSLLFCADRESFLPQRTYRRAAEDYDDTRNLRGFERIRENRFITIFGV